MRAGNFFRGSENDNGKPARQRMSEIGLTPHPHPRLWGYLETADLAEI